AAAAADVIHSAPVDAPPQAPPAPPEPIEPTPPAEPPPTEAAATPEPPAPAPEPDTPEQLAAADGEASAQAGFGEPPAEPPAPPPTQSPPPPPSSSGPNLSDLEKRFGTQWVVWIGGFALALGGILLVRYSIQQGLFTPGWRVICGAILALALVGLGELARRRELIGGVAQIPRAHISSILSAPRTPVAHAHVYATPR